MGGGLSVWEAYYAKHISSCILILSSAISCGHPGVPANAVLTGELFTYGATVQYSCKGGQILTGNSTRVCQEDSHWSGALPHCSGEEPYIQNIGQPCACL